MVFNLTQNKKNSLQNYIEIYLLIHQIHKNRYIWVYILLAWFLWKCKMYTPVEGNLEICKETTYAFIFDPLISFLRIFLKIPQIQRKTWFLIRAKCSSKCGNNCSTFPQWNTKQSQREMKMPTCWCEVIYIWRVKTK